MPCNLGVAIYERESAGAMVFTFTLTLLTLAVALWIWVARSTVRGTDWVGAASVRECPLSGRDLRRDVSAAGRVERIRFGAYPDATAQEGCA